jgi:eukaryotic-like serine/threonine-protein kinase
VNDAARWLRIKELFNQSQDKAVAERDAWLVSQCGEDELLVREVRALLTAQHGSRNILDGSVAGALNELSAAKAVDLVGQHVGAYRLLRLLGEGGMGSVYLAERDQGDFSLRAALKLIRADVLNDEARARFVRERRILAQLSHPHIAQLHDGGMAENGTPYFTLEYVEGEPITKYCDARKLTIRERLQLVLQVCEAVAYAHRNLIVHRDLKPSNIYVTADGQTKLLDFGIAKLLDADAAAGQTATQSRMMTPEYAAPEQVLGEPITTATDVYAIGVLIYELLSGRLPYARADAGTISWSKAVVEEAPEPVYRALNRTTSRGTTPDGAAAAAARGTGLLALRRSLRGDLDRILHRALAKAPETRYATVAALSSDVTAYLDSRAISGGTRTYQMRKFLRRHWLPLGTALMLFCVLVSGALIVAMEDRQIEREAQTSAAVKDFVLGLFGSANPAVAKGKQVTVREIVDRGVQRLATIPSDQVELRAELENTLGTIYYQLGLVKDAVALHSQAFEAIKFHARDTVLAATAERFEATELASQGDNDQAQRLADDAIERLRALSRSPTHDMARALSTAGWIAKKRRDYARAKQLSDEAFALAQQPPADEELLYSALSQRAAAAVIAHDQERAIHDYREALTLSTKLFGSDDQETLNTEQLLGTALNTVSRFDEAQPHLQAAVDSSRHVYGDADVHTLRTEEMLAVNETQWGRCKEAAARLARLLNTAEAREPRDEVVLAEIRLNYAETIVDLGKFDQAEALLVATRDFLRQHVGSSPQELAETLTYIGYVHEQQKKFEVAVAEQRDALAILKAAHDDDVATEDSHLSDVLTHQGDVKQALAVGEDGLNSSIKIYGERAHSTAYAHYCYAMALLAAQETQQAEAQLRAALKSYELLLPPQGMHLHSADVRWALGELLVSHADTRDEAMRLLKDAGDLRETFLGADDPKTKVARQALRNAQSVAEMH